MTIFGHIVLLAAVNSPLFVCCKNTNLQGRGHIVAASRTAFLTVSIAPKEEN